MHPEAMEWMTRYQSTENQKVLDIGARDINGSPRSLFPNADYTGMDVTDGPGVDIVADATVWNPDKAYDVVVCCEVFEHTPGWPRIIGTAWRSLRKGGLFICTMAGPGRAPHSAVDGGRVREGEYYGNVDPDLLEKELERWFRDVLVDQFGPDVRASAVKR